MEPGSVTAPAWATVLLALAMAGATFHVSLASALGQVGGTNPMSVATMAPLVAVIAMLVAIMRDGAPESPRLEPALLGAIPMLLVATGLVAFGPARLSFAFWHLRIDLVAAIACCAGMLMIAVGVRAVTRYGAVFALFLSLPPIVLPLARAIEGVLGDGARLVADKLVEALPLGVRALGGGDYSVIGGGERISVAAACAGLDGLVAVGLVAAPLLIGSVGPMRRKLFVIGMALLVAWSLNMLRIVALLALAGHHNPGAFDLVHQWAGVVMLAGVVAGTMIAAGRAGLSWRPVGLRTPVRYTNTHVLATFMVVTWTVVIATGALAAQAPAGLAGASVQPVSRVAQEQGSDGELRQSLTIPGYEVRQDESFEWFRAFFGPGSQAGSFTILQQGQPPVWAQVLIARSSRKLEQYAPLDCFIVHGSRIMRARRIPLPGGSGLLVDQRLRGQSFSAFSWIQPVVLPDGSSGYRRVVLFADARPGRLRDQRFAESSSRFEQAVYRGINYFTPARERKLEGGSFGPSGRQLVTVADALLEAG